MKLPRISTSATAHLDELQKAFPNDLRVVAIINESPQRLRRFEANTDHLFRFARDTGSLRRLFPHQVIPHAVLIAPDGKVAAITDPQNITVKVIANLLEGKRIALPLKEERQDFDLAYDYFQRDTLSQSAFVLQPYNAAAPTFSKSYPHGPFANRRLTAYNMTAEGLYREAYAASGFRVERTFDQALTDWENEANRYCMDIVVAHPDSLFPVLQEELRRALPVKAHWEKRTKEVAVITTLKGEVLAAEAAPTGEYSARGDGYRNKSATLNDFCQYLEDFGIFGYPVVNETGVSGTFSLDFSFDPEAPESFKSAMSNYGLTYKKVEREINVLVLDWVE